MSKELLKFLEEIAVSDKQDYVKNHYPEKLEWFDAKIKCSHCNEKFVFNEFKVFKDKLDSREYIVCKNFPDCDGSLNAFELI
jgi:hypothetical protein